MHSITLCSVLLAVIIGSTNAFIFDRLFESASGCTILVDVPLVPSDPYYKAELFPNLNAKLAANQNRYDRNLQQVWVDAPDPAMCGFATFTTGARCCLNGRFDSQYRWLVFASGDKKKLANDQLWQEAKYGHYPFYRVYADAPERYCKRSYGGLADFFG